MVDAVIDLAHEADFAIGPLAVRPSTREVTHGGERVVIEPRVMQVFVALHRANGAVVSKDDLIHSCWEDRVVGEDAINRVISRLRRLSEETGAFRVETITRVGYRLKVEGETPTPAQAAGASSDGKSGWSRRSILLGAGGALTVAGAGGFAIWTGTRYRPPAEALELAEAAEASLNYSTPEQVATAISSLQQATRIAPDWSAAWGLLGLAYSQQAMQSPSGERTALLERSRAASARALALDPDNVDAQIAALIVRRGTRTRAAADAEQQRLLRVAPNHRFLNATRGGFLSQVGRTRAAIVHLERAMETGLDNPPTAYAYALALTSAGRLDEGDAAMERAFARWPRHYGVWFSRYKQFLYSNRADAAVAMLANEGGRPLGIPKSNFDLCEVETRAMASRAPADIEAAMNAHLIAARTGVGFAQNAMVFAAATGQLDTAFEVADAYYFDKGFRMPEQRYTREQGLYSAQRGRPSHFLFDRPLAGMRADSRFLGITRGTGLEDYWRAVGVQPDYRA